MLVPREQNSPAEHTDLISVARRHSGWIVGPAFAGLVLSVVGAFLWPDLFQSSATLRYQSQTDELEFEKSLDDRMQFVLSRPSLKTTIERYELYPNDVKRLPLEDVVENMKSKIRFGRIARGDKSSMKVATFPVTFDYTDRSKAQKVVGELSALMIVSNLRSALANASIPTSEAPSADPLEGARKDLEESENLLKEFKEKNAEHMPEQARANQEMLSSLRIGLAKVQNQIIQTTREQATLQASMTAELEKRRNIKLYVDVPDAEKMDNSKTAVFDGQIQVLEEQIKVLKTQYTDNFPDVKQARQKLDKIKADRDAVLKEDSSKTTVLKQRVDTDAARASAAIDAEIKRVQAQIDARIAEADRLSKESAETDRTVLGLQQKVEGGSELEKQYADMLRERDINKGRVDEEEIRFKAASAQTVPMAKPSAIGSPSLEVVDAASLPVFPIEPNRGFIIVAGSLLGIILGLVAAGVREMNDRSIRNLYGQPVMEERYRKSTRNGRAWMPWALGILLGAGVMAAAVTHYYATRT